MIGSPMRFQLAVATVAIGGTFVVVDGQGSQGEARPVLTFQDATVDESSGLVDAGSRLLTVNDSGDGPVVYVVDKASGETVGRTTYTEDDVLDVEALAPGPDDTLWVGDIGDNRWSRSSVAVYALPTPGPGDASVSAQRYDLVYEGGPRDAEALLVHPETGRLHVVSKGLFGGQVFVAPARLRTDQPNMLRPVADVGGLVTDGAYFPDGRFVALRSYSNLTVLEAGRWRNVQGMPLPDQDQGEGLAVTASARSVIVSTEGAGSEVLEVPLSKDILARVAAPSPSPSPSRRSAAEGPGEAAEVVGEEEVRPLPTWAVAGIALVAGSGLVVWLRRRQR